MAREVRIWLYFKNEDSSSIEPLNKAIRYWCGQWIPASSSVPSQTIKCESRTKPFLDIWELKNLPAWDVLHKNEGVKLKKRKICDPENKSSNVRRKPRELPGWWQGTRLCHGPRGQPTQEAEASDRNGSTWGVWTSGRITDRLPDGFLLAVYSHIRSFGSKLVVKKEKTKWEKVIKKGNTLMVYYRLSCEHYIHSLNHENSD